VARTSAPRSALERLAAACESGRLDEPLRAHGVEVLTAFGSAVDPEVDDPGDLDVGVWCGGIGVVDLLGLIEVLADAADHDVDLAVLDTGSVVLISAAVTGRPLWEARSGLVAGLQMRFVPQRMDTAWLRELDLQRLAGR
jgi:predicted nucleotidyltransferase